MDLENRFSKASDGVSSRKPLSLAASSYGTFNSSTCSPKSINSISKFDHLRNETFINTKSQQLFIYVRLCLADDLINALFILPSRKITLINMLRSKEKVCKAESIFAMNALNSWNKRIAQVWQISICSELSSSALTT
ncbi:CLUMA_CG011818, isoform A [Clunio marinus]|uniref:CLUMA_CG011818, isoform A n=1 Tax=Clunio marinus TaxID=568069 RepID=A0A1J1IDY3_9DIPT|nr:CLUMA_CG011818, isoform A [Clunio marinus]